MLYNAGTQLLEQSGVRPRQLGVQCSGSSQSVPPPCCIWHKGEKRSSVVTGEASVRIKKIPSRFLDCVVGLCWDFKSFKLLVPWFLNGSVITQGVVVKTGHKILQSEILLLPYLYYNSVSKLLGTNNGFSDRDYLCSVHVCADKVSALFDVLCVPEKWDQKGTSVLSGTCD